MVEPGFISFFDGCMDECTKLIAGLLVRQSDCFLVEPLLQEVLRYGGGDDYGVGQVGVDEALLLLQSGKFT